MSSNGTSSDVGPTSAVVSLLSLVISFLDSPHIWMQNLTLLVSMCAGFIAIYAGIKRLLK